MTHAYTLVSNREGPGFAIGRAYQDQQGYEPCPEYGTYETEERCRSKIAQLNAMLGLTPAEAWKISATSYHIRS